METVSESAPYRTDCVECGHSTDASVIEVLADGKQEWDLHGTCGNCGSDWYECDFGPPPRSVRAAILAENGPTVLELEAGSTTPAKVMRVLRQMQALPLAQARGLADELLRVGFRGTLVEMESLARPLRAA